jgi:hypothetical protein
VAAIAIFTFVNVLVAVVTEAHRFRRRIDFGAVFNKQFHQLQTLAMSWQIREAVK